MDWTLFEPFMERHGERFTMYAITLPGFGGSEPPPAPAEEGQYSRGPWLDNAERAILQMIKEREIEKPVLVGQSLGGHIAVRLLARHPERFRAGIILQSMPAYPIDGAGAEVSRETRMQKVDGALHEQIQHIEDDQWLQQQREWIQSLTSNSAFAEALAEKNANLPKDTSSRYMLEYLAADVQQELAAAQTPPILVAAAIPHEPGADLEELRAMWPELYEGVERVTIVYFEATRELILIEAPEELDRAIVQFLAGRPVEGKPAETPRNPEDPVVEPRQPSPPDEAPPLREPRAEPRTPHLPPPPGARIR
jgi:pimeloyl-ACP methyl ester carboxylesterase